MLGEQRLDRAAAGGAPIDRIRAIARRPLWMRLTGQSLIRPLSMNSVTCQAPSSPRTQP